MFPETLKNCELFRDLTLSELESISHVITERVVPAGRYIVFEGEKAFSLFAVDHGSVDIIKTTGEGTQPKITELSDGSIFGEMAFFDHPSRSAGVKAQGEVKILEMKYADLECLAEQNPVLGLKLYRSMALGMSRKLRNTTEDLATMIAASRLAAIGEMTTAISHEINNPLTSIMLNAELIGRINDGRGQNRKIIEERATKICETVRRVVKIVDGLKSLARNADADPLVDTSIESIILSTLETCQEKFKISGTTVHIENLQGEALVPCRSVQIAQVMLNLLNNAIDALENQRDKWIRITIEGSEKRITVSVTDSGQGIPEYIREKIFQPFFTTKSRGKGTGLGLSISKSIIESHGGSLTLDHASKNTRFVISLSRQSSPE